MNKQILLKIVNILLAASFIMTAMGGLVRQLVPDAIPYLQFKAIHPKFGIALVVTVILHLILNWGWIKSAYFKKK